MRKSQPKKIPLAPDPKFNDKLVTRFVPISSIDSDAGCTEKGNDVEDPFELNAGFAGVTIELAPENWTDG